MERFVLMSSPNIIMRKATLSDRSILPDAEQTIADRILIVAIGAYRGNIKLGGRIARPQNPQKASCIRSLKIQQPVSCVYLGPHSVVEQIVLVL